MNQETITRTIISNILDQYLVEIAADPNRSIRKLVDLAERVSDGHFQKIFYQMMQEMSHNTDSPYYTLIYELVKRVDPQTIKTVGVNLGYNAWTLGARSIRENEAKTGVIMPWTVLIARNEEKTRIPFAAIAKMVDEARSSDVYAYFFQYDSAPFEREACMDLFSRHPDCVFILMLSPDSLTEEALDDLASLHNLCILISTDADGWQESAAKLTERRCLYGIYCVYQDIDSVAEITCDEWITEALPYYPMFALCLAAPGCSEEDAKEVKEYVFKIRMGQNYAVMPVDLVHDSVLINQIISHRDGFSAVAPDGELLSAESYTLHPTGSRITDQSFPESISDTFK